VWEDSNALSLNSKKKQILNIIIASTTPRTGSSFTGELISAGHDSSFFFEPFWFFIDEHKQPTFQDKQSLLTNLLRCNMRDPNIRHIVLSSKQSNFIFRKPSSKELKHDSLLSRFGSNASLVKKMESRCKRTKVRVIKTIRMNVSEISDFVSELPEEGIVNRNNTHIVYLVRDPRGVINSIKTSEGEWPIKLQSPAYICPRMLADYLQIQEYIQNFHVIRYEDVAVDPWAALVQLFHKLDLSVPPESQRFVEQHSLRRKNNINTSIPNPKLPMNQLFKEMAERKLIHNEMKESGVEDEKSEKIKRRAFRITKRSITSFDPSGRRYYFSTYRNGKDFSPNHWERELHKSVVSEINDNEDCQRVLEAYNYPPTHLYLN